MENIQKFSNIDLYKLIGVRENATENEIRKSYRKKALECHPDKNPNNSKAAEIFYHLQYALQILVDVSTRAAYDRIRNRYKSEAQAHRVKMETRAPFSAAARRAKMETEFFRARMEAEIRRAEMKTDARRAKMEAEARRAREEESAQKVKEETEAQKVKEESKFLKSTYIIFILKTLVIIGISIFRGRNGMSL